MYCSILVSTINPFSKDIAYLKSQEAFLVVRNVYKKRKYLSIRCVTEEEKCFSLNPFFLQKCEDSAEGMQSSANDLMGSQAEQQKHYLRIAFECTCHCCSHFDTKTLKSIPYLKLFEFCMCTAIVVPFIKRKLLIEGIKALKKAAAVSTGFILSQETAGSWLLLRAAKVDCHIQQWGYSRQRPTGYGDFQQDGLKFSCIAVIQTYNAAPIWVFQFKLKGRLEPCWSPVWNSKEFKGISVWCSFSLQ